MGEDNLMKLILELQRKATILEVVENYVQTETYLSKGDMLRILGKPDVVKERDEAERKAEENAETIDAILDHVKPLLHQDEFKELLEAVGLVDKEVREDEQ